MGKVDLRSLSEIFVAKFIGEKYGFEVSRVSRLGGYSDINYFLQKECGKSGGLVLKVKQQTTQNEGIQWNITQHLSGRGFSVSTFVKSLKGETTSHFPTDAVGDKKECKVQVQVFVFVEGEPLYDVELENSKQLALIRNVGRFCGLFVNQVKDLEKPEPENLAPQYPEWDSARIWSLENMPEVVRYVGHVKDEEIVRITLELAKIFRDKVASRLHLFRQGYIHGDLSDTNLLLCDKQVATSPNPTAEDLKKAIGLIDFEESWYSYTVFDVSICVAYVMIYCEKHGLPVHEAARVMLKGYMQVSELGLNELEVLATCVLARLVVSFVMSEHNSAEDPDNEHVYKAQARFCPRIIKDIWSRGVDKVLGLWM